MSYTTEHPALLQARQQAKQQAQASKMSITQSFYLANQARGKLSSEAAKSDHQLRRLVGHANLLDRLMLHLSQAEQEQDAWFNNMVRGNSADAEEERLQSWESISEEPIGYMASDYSDSDSDSDDDEEIDEDDFSLFPALTIAPSRKQDSRSYIDTIVEVDEVEAEEYDEEDSDEDGLYTLERTTSHRPPSLVSDASDSEDEDDNTPPSPSQSAVIQPVLSEKQRQQIVTTSYYETTEHQLSEEAYFLPSQTNMISAY